VKTLGLLLVLTAVVLAGEPVTLIVLHTNDLHGQLDPQPASPRRAVLRGKPAGGFAHLATMVRAVRKEAAGRVVLLDAGDIFQGTPIGNETRGDAVIECMNALAYHAGALGNHEFDFGIPNMLRLVKRADFPVLAANMTGEMGAIKPWVILRPKGLDCRIAVIGLITDSTPDITSPAVGRAYKFADPIATTKRLVREIKADLYIVVSHCGIDVEKKLAESVPQLALVVGGHSHTPITHTFGTVLVSQTHAKSLSLGRVDIELDPDTWKVLKAQATLLPVDPQTTPADPALKAVIDKHRAVLGKKLQEVLGTLTEPAQRKRGKFSSSAGNWMTDVIRDVGKAQIGFTNKGGLRADLEAGKVTLADVYRLMPFENVVVSMDLTGSDVRSLILKHLSKRHSLEWSGMRVRIQRDRNPEITVAGKPLDDAATYRVATNSFLAWGGDGFTTFKRGMNRRNSGVLLRDAMAEDLRRRVSYAPPREPRLVAEKPPR
jgi:2',3'-cyclic-nucleotide 2'-phosphodiesterase (5'-nucleotidase family)